MPPPVTVVVVALGPPITSRSPVELRSRKGEALAASPGPSVRIEEEGPRRGGPGTPGEVERTPESPKIPLLACFALFFFCFSSCVQGCSTQADIQNYLMDCKINYHSCQS